MYTCTVSSQLFLAGSTFFSHVYSFQLLEFYFSTEVPYSVVVNSNELSSVSILDGKLKCFFSFLQNCGWSV